MLVVLVITCIVAVLVVALTRSGTEAFDGGVDAAVIGGSPASYADFPFYCDVGGCGGVLIAPDVVLTAAHCKSSRPGTNVVVGGGKDTVKVKRIAFNSMMERLVRVGLTDQATDQQTINFYTSFVSNDLKLLRLERAVRGVKPIPLATSHPRDGTATLIIGRGKQTYTGSSSGAFMKAWLPYRKPENAVQLIEAENAANFGGQLYKNISKSIAASRAVVTTVSFDRRSGCHGDSGGPLVIPNRGRWELLGIVSSGPVNCNQNMKKSHFSMFVSVPFHRAWIAASSS